MTAAVDVADARVPEYLGRVLDENNDPAGTCFQVATGVLVTAWHVLDHIGAAAENVRVRIDPLASGKAFDAVVARLDQAHDLAVLVSEGHLSASAEELIATDQMAPRTAVTVTGHSVITDSGRIARSLTTIGQWTGPATWEDAPPAGRMTAEALMPGMSGAPVIRDSDAVVAGVVSGRYNSADDWLKGTVWVARTEDLTVLLDGIAVITLKQPLPESPVTGRPLAEVNNPFALEVHRPVQPEDAPPGLPLLPPYVTREHDQVLSQVVRAAAVDRSGIAVLVGGSSTGKTRACWEALQLLRDQDPPWRLWHPIDPSRPDAALAELPGIGPRTVVWLNEAQFYLDTADGLGERVAAGLRELLRDLGRAPVLVLATVWPQFWDTLTTRPAGGDDRHAQARELLSGHDITVPAAFTPARLQQLSEAGDARLVLAARSAPDGEVIQFLAGAPELLARYRNAPPAAAALIEAAMDARRLGTGPGLPQAFLQAAAPGYLTDAEWDALGQDWLEQALAYTAVPCKGARGPLTRIRPRPARSAARYREDQPASMDTAVGPLYRLADYLDQHGRAHRASQIPPADFWSAAAYTDPDDQNALGDAAHTRGLYRDAAQLDKNAAASGNIRAALYLSHPAACLRADPRPVHWAAAHAALDNPGGVAGLLQTMRQAGAHEQAAALLARDPAAHVAHDNPYHVADLLDTLRQAGAREQAAALAARAAAHAALDNPGGVAGLMQTMRQAGAHEQAAALLARDPAAHVAHDNPYHVANLLDTLRQAGAREQAAALAARAAAHAPLDNLGGVARLMRTMRQAGAYEQAGALAARAAAHAPLDNPGGVALLLIRLRQAGAREQAAALLARDPAAHAPLDNPYHVADLLDALRETGAREQAAALLARDPAAHALLDSPEGMALLLDRLLKAGADEQVAALAARAAAHAPLDNPGRVARLLDTLREMSADEQVAALAARAAAHAPLDNPGLVAHLLDALRETGADEQVAALLARDPAAHVAIDGPGGVALLLIRLRRAGAHEQVAVLLARDLAAHAALDSHSPADVDHLLQTLRQAGAHEQAVVLTARLPMAGMFELFIRQQGPADQFRFGREADGTTAAPWGWEDLDLWLVSVRGTCCTGAALGGMPTWGGMQHGSPAHGRQRRNRRDERNNTHPNRPRQFFEAQLAGGAVEEFN